MEADRNLCDPRADAPMMAAMQRAQQRTRMRESDAELVDETRRLSLRTPQQDYIEEVFLKELLRADNFDGKIRVLSHAKADTSICSAMTDNAAAVDALLALLQSHDSAHAEVVEITRLVLVILWKCCLREDVANVFVARGVLSALLRQLTRPGREQDELYGEFAALLRSICCVVKHKHAPLSALSPDIARTAISVLLTTTTTERNDATGLHLLELLELLSLEGREAVAAIHDNLMEVVAAHPGNSISSLRWERVKLWDLGSNLPGVAEILRDGTVLEQKGMLKCLLSTWRSIREHLVLFHDGARLLTALVQQEESSDVRILACRVAKDVAVYNTECRVNIRNFQIHNGENTAKLLSNDFFREIAPEEDLLLLGFLQTGTDKEKSAALTYFEANDSDVLVDFCIQYDVLGIFVNAITNPGPTRASTVGLAQRLWALIPRALHQLKQCGVTTFPSIRALVAMALHTLASDDHQNRDQAVATLRSPLLKNVIVGSGGVGTVVHVLAQEEDPFVARQLVALLRDLAASGLHYARAIDALIVESVCGDGPERALCSPSRQYPQAIHYQNLLLVYRDIAEVEFGSICGVNTIICATAAMEALHKASDAEKVIILSLLHSALELDGSDPLYFVVDSCGDVRLSVLTIVQERMMEILDLALHGPRKCWKLARRILTAVAVSDPTSCKKLRMCQLCYQPQPALLPSELLHVENSGHGGEEARGEEQGFEYQYSDCGDSDEGISEQEAAEETMEEERDASDGEDWEMIAAAD